jgi:hypothetical protein
MAHTADGANARTLPETTSYPDAYVRALAAEFKAALQAITAPADDPIFELIEAHRKAWARIVDAHENLKGALSEEAFTFEIKARDSKVADAKNELLKTPPATLAGARAIIEYLIEWDKDCDPETSYEYLSTLLRSPMFAQEEARP